MHSPIRAARAIVAAAGSSGSVPETPDFTPATPKPRGDGWSPQRQLDFIAALAESGCVTEACQMVGASPSGAYRLRARVDAVSFRAAWDAALDMAIRRLSDAALSRALNGVRRPIFYQGEQIGERVYYDERLAMFLLRTRDARNHGAWRDRREPRRQPDAEAATLAHWLGNLRKDAAAQAAGRRVRRTPEPDATEWLNDAEAEAAGKHRRHLHGLKVRPTPEETNAEIMRRIAIVRAQAANKAAECEQEDVDADDGLSCGDTEIPFAAVNPAAARTAIGPRIARLEGDVS